MLWAGGEVLKLCPMEAPGPAGHVEPFGAPRARAGRGPGCSQQRAPRIPCQPSSGAHKEKPDLGRGAPGTSPARPGEPGTGPASRTHLGDAVRGAIAPGPGQGHRSCPRPGGAARGGGGGGGNFLGLSELRGSAPARAPASSSSCRGGRADGSGRGAGQGRAGLGGEARQPGQPPPRPALPAPPGPAPISNPQYQTPTPAPTRGPRTHRRSGVHTGPKATCGRRRIRARSAAASGVGAQRSAV